MLQVVNRERRPAFKVFRAALRKRIFDFMLLVMVETRVSSDLVHPRLKTAFGSKRLAVLQHSDEHILNQVLSETPATGQPRKELEQCARMSVEKYAQFCHIAASNGQHQHFIRFGHS
jgi:hypothetical protein